MKNVTYITLVILCVLCFQSKAQTYFNKSIDLFGKADLCADIFSDNNQYYISAGGLNAAQTDMSLSILKLDSQANIITSKYYFKQNNWFYPALNHGIIKVNDSLLSSSGYRTDVSNVSYGYIYTFKKNLDSIRYKEYGFLNKTNVVYNQILIGSKFQYLIGYTDSTQTNSDILLIKTDTSGNELWKKKIGLTSWDENALTIDTLQGQLIIAGYKTPHGSWSPLGFVMRLDTAGNIIWNKTVNTNLGGGCSVKTLKDGNILVYSQYKQYSIGSNDYYRLQVEKITPNNVSLWGYKYNAPTISAGPSSAIENKHGNIVIAGQQCYTPGLYVNGVVNEISQNGDSIFSREYFKMGGSQNYFRDVVQTNDGGYCFAGFIIPVPANGGTGTEDIWLIKVDSNFCESATPCGYGVGLEPLSFGEELGVRLYPNPVNESLTLAWVEGEGIEPNTVVTIMNNLGEIVLSPLSLGEGLRVRTINTSHLPSGLYYLSIKTKDKTMTRKIMIQK